MIKGLSVYVTYSTYKATAEREKEKVRRPQLTDFINNIQKRLSQLDYELNQAVADLALEPKDITDDNGLIREAEYPELRAKQDELMALSPISQEIFRRFYLYGGAEIEPYEYTVTKEVMDAFGFDEAWIKDPILLSMKDQIYCGDYGGEPITQEFYYNRLKAKMGETEDC